MLRTLALFVLCLAVSSVRAEEAPSFVNDVEPILTRYGCNSGGCHGKLSGQNGFGLSLRGYAPDDDHKRLTREESFRRIDYVSPENSLILRKPLGDVPHGGGRLWEENSQAYLTLKKWIEAGAPGPKADEARCVRIDMQPKVATPAVGAKQQLTVQAFYSDGTQRDVTWLAKFHANDSGTAEVSAEGTVTAKRHGETSVLAQFDGMVDTASFTMRYSEQVKPEWYAAKNNPIDEPVMNKLQSLGIEPSDACDDATFLRRVTLDLIGTLPTPEEVRTFAADSRPDKRAKWVDALLERPEFVDYWTLQLADLLQNRKERDHDVRGAKGVRSLHAWLRKQLAENRPWSEIARDVITAKGTVDEQPAVGYFVVTVGEKQAEQSDTADSVAQAFLGTRIGCAKCHNHPLEKYTQDDYYHFLAFFSRVALDRKDPKDGVTSLVIGTQHSQNLRRQIRDEAKKLEKLQADKGDAKQIEESTKRIANWEAELKKHLGETAQVRQPRTGKMMLPQPLDRKAMEIPGEQDPREKLASWMIDPSNESFSGAMVNRLWKHFFSVGLVEPVDDLRATNPPSNRELWAYLNKEFTESNFNLRHIMRLMVTSRTYQLSSTTKASNATDSRFYSHYYPRRLPAEVMLDAVCQATGVPETFPGYPQGVRAIQLPGPQIDSYFLTVFGRSDRVTACACERMGDVTLPQLLHLQNSESLQNKIQDGDGRLAKLLADPKSDVVGDLYAIAFGRSPRDDERKAMEAIFEGGADRREVAGDLFWALLNAKEFAFNH